MLRVCVFCYVFNMCVRCVVVYCLCEYPCYFSSVLSVFATVLLCEVCVCCRLFVFVVVVFCLLLLLLVVVVFSVVLFVCRVMVFCCVFLFVAAVGLIPNCVRCVLLSCGCSLLLLRVCCFVGACFALLCCVLFVCCLCVCLCFCVR